MTLIAHPGRLLKRELTARRLSANRLALDLGVPSSPSQMDYPTSGSPREWEHINHAYDRYQKSQTCYTPKWLDCSSALYGHVLMRTIAPVTVLSWVHVWI